VVADRDHSWQNLWPGPTSVADRQANPMRILHFSDPHIGIRLRNVPLQRWLSKRALGGLHLFLGRGRYFLEAREKLAALDEFRREQRIDLVICTGDYTALGLERELRDARAAVDPLLRAPLGYIGVPGNHDLYIADVVRQKRFEKFFGDTMGTDLPDSLVNEHWPQVRLLGDEVAVIAVNSSRPNPPWRSSGSIPRKQLAALRDLLGDARLSGRFVFVITHYAPRLANGRPDRLRHGLVNADVFLQACAGATRGAILCGHVHHCFRVAVPQTPLPIFCAGSTTVAGREGLWVFEVKRGVARATRGCWDGGAYRLVTDSAQEV